MKAIVRRRYGSPEVLRLEEIEKPAPKDDEVLIKVRAASLNAGDKYALRGQPYVARGMLGLWKPKTMRLGSDFAGQVEAVGGNVTQFKPGDAVYGIRTGAFAEYVVKLEQTLAPKPANLSFEEAAAVPVAGITALQGLRDKGGLKPGQTVLVNGASGGVGTFAVQVAKALGAHVTAVCGPRNVGLARSLGADRVMDYSRENFTLGEERYDQIFDNAGTYPLAACRRVLGPDGVLVVVGAPPVGGLLGPAARLLQAVVLSQLGKKNIVTFITAITKQDLLDMTALIEDGQVKPVIDKSYPLAELPEAMRYQEEGHPRGKVVLRVAANDQP